MTKKTAAVLGFMAVLTAASVAQAEMSDNITISGEVTNMTTDTISVKTSGGAVFVPRANFKEANVEPRPGSQVTGIKASLSEIVALNKKLRSEGKRP